MRDLFRRSFQQRAATVFEDLSQIQRDPLYAVEGRDFFGGLHLFLMFLPVVNGKSQNLPGSIFFYGKSQADRTVKPSAE